MNHREIAAVIAGVVPAVRDFVANATKDFVARLDALEKRPVERGEPGPQGEPGKDADPLLIERAITEAVAKIPPGKDGRDGKDGEKGDPGKDAPSIEQIVEAIAPSNEGIRNPLRSAVAEYFKIFPPEPGPAGNDGEPGAPGKDADPEFIKAVVAEAVAQLPPAKDGERGPAGKDGEPGTPGKDADPELIKAAVAEVVAKLPPAKDGRDGKDADPVAIEKAIADAVAKIPPPKDGRDGENGRDGRDASDLQFLKGLIPGLVTQITAAIFKTIEFSSDDGGRTLALKLTVGDEFVGGAIKTAALLDRGVWREASTYDKGDGVTWGGSFWIAQRDLPGKPDTDDGGWRLAVKKGRDGRSAYDLALSQGFKGSNAEWVASLRGERGAKGEPGRDGRSF